MTSIKSFIKLCFNIIFAKSAYRFFIRDWVSLGDLSRCADAIATARHTVNLKPILMNAPTKKKIFVIAPHPDDEILGPGGTLITAIANGSSVRVIYLSKGKEEQANSLMREAEAISNLVGYQISFMDYRSRQIPLHDEIITRLRLELTDYRPDIIMLPFLTDDHDDHRRASDLLMRTVSTLERNALEAEVWAFQVYSSIIPNVVIDVTNVITEKKQAIEKWSSQKANRNWAHFTLGLNAFNTRFLPDSRDKRYAEAFFVLPLREYNDICRTYFIGQSKSYYCNEYVNE
jgi:LmbE family N-acetylglucosaminyl deacetylase